MAISSTQLSINIRKRGSWGTNGHRLCIVFYIEGASSYKYSGALNKKKQIIYVFYFIIIFNHSLDIRTSIPITGKKCLVVEEFHQLVITARPSNTLSRASHQRVHSPLRRKVRPGTTSTMVSGHRARAPPARRWGTRRTLARGRKHSILRPTRIVLTASKMSNYGTTSCQEKHSD